MAVGVTTVEAEGELSMVGTMSKMSQDVSAMRDRMLHSIDEMGTTFTNMRKLTEAMEASRNGDMRA